MAGKVQFIDKLRDRGFVDQWGFIVFAVVGFAAIVSAKSFKVDTIGVAAGACLAMMFYAILIGRAGTGSLRADQAGDNCYYLGLIYTLASLSYAIATFDPNDTASTIVRGFGVALATTIFGLILRVFFSQGRPDLENIEEQSRLELTEASSRLKRELSSVVLHMNDFNRQVQQSMQEMKDSSTSTIEELTKTLIEGLREAVTTANEAIRTEAGDFAKRSKRYSTSFDNLLSKLEQHNSSFQQLGNAHEALSATANSAKLTAESAFASMETLQKSVVSASAAAGAAENAGEATRRMAEQMASAVGHFEQSLEAIRGETDRHLTDLRNGPAEAVEKIIASLNQASDAFNTQLEQVAQLHDSIQMNIASQAEAALATSKRHNDKLEEELARSTVLVSKVHTSLVEMTEGIANSVEGSP